MERFTLLAPDAYRGDTLDTRLYDAKGKELARELLYMRTTARTTRTTDEDEV